MDLGLTGKKVVISAATRGLGRVTAKTMLEEGATVSICGRRPGGGEKAEFGAQGEGHPLAQDGVAEAVSYLEEFGTVHGQVVDCADEEAVRNWVVESGEQMGGIDIVISNASALGGKPNDRAGWDINYQVDLLSGKAMFEAAYPWLAKAEDAAFVQVSSAAAIENHPFGDSFSYGAMKAAVINYVNQLAHRYHPEGIRCNCVCPGPTYIEDGSWGFLKDHMPDYYVHNRDRHPSKRFGRPEEIADVIAFLASKRSSWIIGENIAVDGGYTKHVKY